MDGKGEVERRIKTNDTEWVKHIVSILNFERKVETCRAMVGFFTYDVHQKWDVFTSKLKQKSENFKICETFKIFR